MAECEVLVRRLDNAALRRERQLGRGWKLVPAPGLEEKGVHGVETISHDKHKAGSTTLVGMSCGWYPA